MSRVRRQPRLCRQTVVCRPVLLNRTPNTSNTLNRIMYTISPCVVLRAAKPVSHRQGVRWAQNQPIRCGNVIRVPHICAVANSAWTLNNRTSVLSFLVQCPGSSVALLSAHAALFGLCGESWTYVCTTGQALEGWFWRAHETRAVFGW